MIRSAREDSATIHPTGFTQFLNGNLRGEHYKVFNPPPPAGAMYGPSWNGSASSFSNANNYATGCYAASNNPTDCNGAMLQRMGREFVENLPGSVGEYSGQVFELDSTGRLARQSNPTETNAGTGWAATGDDATNGWLYTAQSYDWKGRPRITTNIDGTQRSATYEGCGCAGGEVVTLTDEVGRRQRVYSDALGRAWKTEALNADGSVYSTTTNTFNALDQLREVKAQAGTDGAAQLTTLTYDGHGRLKRRHLPRYDAGAADTYEYDADDVPLKTTDPRGVVTTYGFTNEAGYTNKRHLVNRVTYGNAPAGVPVPAAVRFEYDAAGNRTSMADSTGSVSYSYNALSQLTSESRQFAGLAGHTYTTTYDYTVSGRLKSVIDPAGSRVDYGYDAAGRMLNVTGSGPASAPSYATNMKYRAWGGLKDVDFGNQTHQFFGYDSRLRAATMELRNVTVNATNPTPVTMRWDYDYYADGRLDHAYDLRDNRFDRKLDYDEQGRLKEAYTGLEARGLSPTEPADSPYRQTFRYDAWGNLTGRTGRLWKHALTPEASTYGADDRRDDWTYDAAGNLTQSESHADAYDASGAQVSSRATAESECGGARYEIAQGYDGEGRPAHRAQTKRLDLGGEPTPSCVTQAEEAYYVYAAGLGGAKLLELDASGEKVKGYVYGGGALLATQEVYQHTNGSAVKWRHHNPGSTSWVETRADRVYERQEMDALGAEVGTFDPVLLTPVPYYDVHTDAPLFVDGGDPFHLSDGCGDIDGMPASCSEISERLGNGSARFVLDRGGVHQRELSTPDYGLGGQPVPTSVWIPDSVETETRRYANGNTLQINYVSSDGHWASTGAGFSQRGRSSLQRPQNDGRAQLTDLQRDLYEKTRANAINLVKDSRNGLNPCAKFINSRLASGEVLKALQLQHPYDGPRSTIIKRDAGLVPAGNPAENEPASNIFEGTRPNWAATAIYKERTRYDVYINLYSYDETTLIHEALHSALKINDIQLAEFLTGKDYSSDLFKTLGASKAVQDVLIANGCAVKY